MRNNSPKLSFRLCSTYNSRSIKIFQTYMLRSRKHLYKRISQKEREESSAYLWPVKLLVGKCHEYSWVELVMQCGYVV